MILVSIQGVKFSLTPFILEELSEDYYHSTFYKKASFFETSFSVPFTLDVLGRIFLKFYHVFIELFLTLFFLLFPSPSKDLILLENQH